MRERGPSAKSAESRCLYLLWGIGALLRAMRRCLMLRQGASPLRPGPLSLDADCIERSQSVKGTQAAQKRRALDRLPPF